MEMQAHAKVNLTLDVLFRRADGYHELKSIMQAISLADTVSIESDAGISVRADIPLPENNTAQRAAQLFFEKTKRGCCIYITKRIPSEAGLGGASADAAAVLKGLNALYGSPISETELYALGLAVGADVPFCLAGGCCLAEGVGERLTPLKSVPLELLIVKGSGGVSTAKLFSSLELPVRHPRTDEALSAIERGSATALAPLCENALESAASLLLPEIAQNKRRMLEAGALSAFMTGSGACVAGVFPSRTAAQSAAASFADLPFACACRGL